jgi:hypothetical protein
MTFSIPLSFQVHQNFLSKVIWFLRFDTLWHIFPKNQWGRPDSSDPQHTLNSSYNSFAIFGLSKFARIVWFDFSKPKLSFLQPNSTLRWWFFPSPVTVKQFSIRFVRDKHSNESRWQIWATERWTGKLPTSRSFSPPEWSGRVLYCNRSNKTIPL